MREDENAVIVHCFIAYCDFNKACTKWYVNTYIDAIYMMYTRNETTNKTLHTFYCLLLFSMVSLYLEF